MSELRIYVACLASYNNGILHGAWIDCGDKDATEMQEEVAEMLRRSPVNGAEEFAIHDHEGFGGRLIGEYTPLADVATIADALSGGDAVGFRWLVNDRGMDVREAAERAGDVNYQDRDVGQSCERMLADYAEEFLKDTGALESVPDSLRGYIDFEAVGRDMRLGGDVDVFEDGSDVYLITNAAEF